MVEEIRCSRCNVTNTEFSTFSTHTSINYDGAIKTAIAKLLGKGDVDINICQKCQSLMFRGEDQVK